MRLPAQQAQDGGLRSTLQPVIMEPEDVSLPGRRRRVVRQAPPYTMTRKVRM